MGGGNSKTTTEKSDVGPWKVQAPYLESAFKSAQTIYDSLDKRGPYKGDFVAAPNQDQYGVANNILDWIKSTGAQGSNALLDYGSKFTKAGLDNFNTATAGLSDLSNREKTIADIIAGANQVREGFDVPGAVNSALSDARYQLANETLPNLYRNAAVTGNINSARTALSDGVVRGRLADTAANISADLLNKTYGQGLDVASQDAARRLEALNNLGSFSGILGNLGLNATNSGLEQARSNFGIGQSAADSKQRYDQSKLDNEIAKFYEPDRFYWDKLKNYMGIVGSNSWGEEGTRTSTTKERPSALSTVGSVLGGIGGLIKK